MDRDELVEVMARAAYQHEFQRGRTEIPDFDDDRNKTLRSRYLARHAAALKAITDAGYVVVHLKISDEMIWAACNVINHGKCGRCTEPCGYKNDISQALTAALSAAEEHGNE